MGWIGLFQFNRLLLFPSVKEAQVKHSAIKKEIEKLQKKIEEERKLIDRIEESLENLEETYFDCTDFEDVLKDLIDTVGDENRPELEDITEDNFSNPNEFVFEAVLAKAFYEKNIKEENDLKKENTSMVNEGISAQLQSISNRLSILEELLANRPQ